MEEGKNSERENELEKENLLVFTCKTVAYFMIVRIFSNIFAGETVGSLISLTIFTGMIVLYVQKICKQSGWSYADCYLLPIQISLRTMVCVFLFYGFWWLVGMCHSGELVWNRLGKEEMFAVVLPDILLSGLGSGINEEMLFRGVLFCKFRERCGTKRAIFLVALVFGLGHLANQSFNLLNSTLVVLHTGSISIILSLVMLRTKNIWTSVCIHAVINLNDRLISMVPKGAGAPISLFTFFCENEQFIEKMNHVSTIVFVVMVGIAVVKVLRMKEEFTEIQDV